MEHSLQISLIHWRTLPQSTRGSHVSCDLSPFNFYPVVKMIQLGVSRSQLFWVIFCWNVYNLSPLMLTKENGRTEKRNTILPILLGQRQTVCQNRMALYVQCVTSCVLYAATDKTNHIHLRIEMVTIGKHLSSSVSLCFNCWHFQTKAFP